MASCVGERYRTVRVTSDAVERISGSQLATRLGMPLGLATEEPLTDPLLVVDLQDDVDNAAMAVAVASALRGVPVIAVALRGWQAGHQLAGAFDLVLPGAKDLAPIEVAVAAHPIAAVALAVLLRGTAERSLVEGLVAESTTYAVLQSGAEHGRWLTSRPRRAPRRASPARPAVRTSRIGDSLRLTLDRPEVHNAFSAEMRDELLEGLGVAMLDPDVHVDLDGAGPSFCSGGDLDEFGTLPDPAVAHIVRLARSVGRAIASVSDRVTVRVHGSCVGAGVELPAFAGHIVADPSARFSLPEVGMGLVPGAGGTVSIPRRIGRQRAAFLALTGSTIDAPTALDWGLIDAVEPTERL